jgi:hypothetical protein
MKKRLRLTLTVLAVVVVALALVAMRLPTPMGTDLSLVGQGKPAVVLAYENYSPVGGDALARLNAVRAEYEGRMVFVLADLGTSQGRAFASRYNLHDGLVAVLAADGTPLTMTGVPADPQVLRARLDGVLAGKAGG